MRFKIATQPQEELFTEKPHTAHQKADSSYSIKIIGIGGAGCKTVNLMMKTGQSHFPSIPEISFITINTDKQDLASSRANHKIQIGIKLTNGMGSGGKPEIGKKAIEENYDDVKQVLLMNDSQQEIPPETKVTFIICGMGGGTGTGAAPIVAQMAKEEGDFVVGIVTTPFYFEGNVRIQQANEGIHKLKRYTDALINIPNQKLFTLSDEIAIQTGIEGIQTEQNKENPFIKANKILIQVVHEIIEIILYPALVNIDFADLCSVISEQGETGIGIGMSMGKDRAFNAVKQAINSSILTEKNIKRATGVLVNITSGNKIEYKELQEIFSAIREAMKDDTNMIFGIRLDEKLQDELKVTLIAGGIKENRMWNEKQNFKIPTFKRKNIPLLQYETHSAQITGTNYNDSQTPVFIRRKK